MVKASYYYNANGQRTQKALNTGKTDVFHYDLGGNLIMRSREGSNPLEDYIWVDGELVKFTQTSGRSNDGSIRTENTKTFVTVDHLMTPMLGTNDDQTLVWRWDSDAFHQRRQNFDPDGDNQKINLFIGFPGQYYDQESQLYYNWNRYYDPKTGRYVTSDPIGLDGGLNTFGYVGGNPIKYFDFAGLRITGEWDTDAPNGGVWPSYQDNYFSSDGGRPYLQGEIWNYTVSVFGFGDIVGRVKCTDTSECGEESTWTVGPLILEENIEVFLESGVPLDFAYFDDTHWEDKWDGSAKVQSEISKWKSWNPTSLCFK